LADGICGEPGSLHVPIGSGTESAIISKLVNGRPGGGTPTGATLQMVGGLSGFVASDRDSFVILVTDGLPNCNSANCQQCVSCNQNPSGCSCTVNADGTSSCCNPTARSCGNF